MGVELYLVVAALIRSNNMEDITLDSP